MRFVLYTLLVIACISVSCVGKKEQGYEAFDLSQAPDAYRFKVQIPVAEFMSRHLNGYTDPDLRSILAESTSDNQSPHAAFQRITELADEKTYNLTKYLAKANPDLFGECTSNIEIQQKLEELYTTETGYCLERLHDQLEVDSIIHNIFINNDLNLIIELKTSDKKQVVKDRLSGTRSDVLVMRNVCMLSEVMDHFLFVESFSTVRDSLTGMNKSLFSYLKLPPLMYLKNQLNPYQVWAGTADVRDTAYINSALNATRYNSPNYMEHAWEKALDMPGDYFKLYFLYPFYPERNIISSDIADVSAVESSYDPTVWEVKLTLTDEGALKWFIQTSSNVDRFLAILVDGSIVCAPRVMTPIPQGICVISNNFSKEQAQNLANRIQYGTLPYSLEVVREGKD